ncbi:ABC transporter permease [Mycoplasmatota bacterium WC44]
MNKNTKFEILRTSTAILIAIGISLALILMVSDAPLIALKDLFIGPFTSMRRFGNVIELAIPLMITGSAVAIIFSSDQINLGAEGAFYFGGVIAMIVALAIPMPSYLHFFAAMILAGITGAIIVTIPTYLKEKTGSSEIVSSLMFNYILFFLGSYILYYYFKDPNAGVNTSYLFPESFKLTRILPGTKVHTGLFLAFIIVILSYIFLYKTTIGYKIRAVGQNKMFTMYTGMKTFRITLISQMVGGFVAGIGGAIQLAGMYKRFQWIASPGYGWDGIIVSTLAKNNPLYVPFAAFFIAYIRIGADIMSRGDAGVPTELVAITQGIIIILIVAQQFLAKYKNKMIYKESKLELEKSGGKE